MSPDLAITLVYVGYALAVLLTFVLARVFTEGARMSEDNERKE